MVQRFDFNSKTKKFNIFTYTKSAFTLAEVLITLGIIGVVAAMTIPTLMKNQQEMATVVALKKAYSILTNAYNMAVQENGDPTNWNMVGPGDSMGAQNAMNILAPYMKITENCGGGVGCFPNTNYLNVDGTGGFNYYVTNSDWAKVKLIDGMLVNFYVRDLNCAYGGVSGNLQLNNVCADLGVDINGSKGPNITGKDYFRFWVTKYGIVPKGTANSSGYDFNGSCLTANGEACTAWVIYNENMDYLHCTTLGWNGNHKCP